MNHALISQSKPREFQKVRPEHTSVDRLQIITKNVCDYMNVDSSLLFEKCRRMKIVEARQIVCYLAHKEKITKSKISLFFGQDHTTIIHAIRKIEQLMEVDMNFRLLVIHIKTYVKLV